MKFSDHTALAVFLNELFTRYRNNVPAVDKITGALLAEKIIGSESEIVNDHIAFRTLGVPHLGIASFEKIFLHHGYRKMDHYHFEGKKLDAFWYAPPSTGYPRIFLSELIVTALSAEAQKIISHYTAHIQADPVDALDLDNGAQIAEFLHQPLWPLPTLADYRKLLEESEYAAWVIYNRYYLNHYTISVHALMSGYNTLPEFNGFAERLGIKLNDSGGKIKVSDDELLRQSSSVADMQEAVFANGETMRIAGSYVEFAERSVLPQYKHLPAADIKPEHRRDGFETANADKIFESTYIEQTRK